MKNKKTSKKELLIDASLWKKLTLGISLAFTIGFVFNLTFNFYKDQSSASLIQKTQKQEVNLNQDQNAILLKLNENQIATLEIKLQGEIVELSKQIKKLETDLHSIEIKFEKQIHSRNQKISDGLEKIYNKLEVNESAEIE